MYANAKQYNRPDSQIFTDSTILESVVTSTLNSLTQGNVIYYPYKKSDKNWSENASCSLELVLLVATKIIDARPNAFCLASGQSKCSAESQAEALSYILNGHLKI
jgi:hypothetical protein